MCNDVVTGVLSFKNTAWAPLLWNFPQIPELNILNNLYSLYHVQVHNISSFFHHCPFGYAINLFMELSEQLQWCDTICSVTRYALQLIGTVIIVDKNNPLCTLTFQLYISLEYQVKIDAQSGCQEANICPSILTQFIRRDRDPSRKLDLYE